MFQFLTENRILEEFVINWNNIRGQVGAKIIEGLTQALKIKKISMNNNLLGFAYDNKEPPVCKLLDLLKSSLTIEEIDISFNFIEQKSIFCLSNGMKFTPSLKNLIVDGNPIGPVGLRFLI